ncbi:MAG: hypothetical protein RMA76_12005 [Deltaproteobacteria bacterium]|jgi:hypothetical protein
MTHRPSSAAERLGPLHPLPGPFASPKIAVRFHLDNPFAADLSALVAVFHDLVIEGLEGESLVDVITQVPGSRSLLLVATNAHYVLTDGPHASLTRVQRRRWSAPVRLRLFESIGRTLELVTRIGDDPRTPPSFTVRTDSFEVAVHDPLYAPNDRETFERGAPIARNVLSELYDEPIDVTPTGTVDAPFTLRIDAPERDVPWLRRRARALAPIRAIR